MKNDLKIDFQLLSTSTPPLEISKITGIIADTALMKGERNPSLDLPRQNIWSIESKVNSDDVLEHWTSIEIMLTNAKEKIREIAKTGKAKFTLVIYAKHRVPSITIPVSMSEFAGYVNAVIDIDHLQQ
jgi:Domain of unknown function (DUF4279)